MKTICLRAAHLWDGRNDPVENGAVLLRNGKITASGSYASLTIPEEAEITDFGDATLIPGLIDGHTHPVCQAGGLEAHDWIYTVSERILYEITKENALWHLRSGVTTIFDNGGYKNITLRVRDEINAGAVVGSDIFSSKVILRPAAPNVMTKGGDIDTSEPGNVQRFVHDMIVNDNVDWIKLYITRGGLARYMPQYWGWGPVFSDAAMTEMVSEAHANGRKVGAHAVTKPGIESMIRNHGDLIIHCQFYEGLNGSLWQSACGRDKVLEDKIVDSGIWVNPTLYTTISPYYVLEKRKESIPLTEAQIAESRDTYDSYQMTKEIVYALWERGVPMVAGSDSGFCYVVFGNFRKELYEYDSMGIPVVDILKMATVNPAKFMNKEGFVGCLTPGADADAAIFRGNVFKDIHCLDNPLAVFKKGIRYV